MAKGELVVKKKDITSDALGEGSSASVSFLQTIETCEKAIDKSCISIDVNEGFHINREICSRLYGHE